MEIPILLGSRPSIANPGIWVPIRFDRWVVVVYNVVDSELVLHFNNPAVNPLNLSNLNGEVFDGPCQVRTEFVKRGTERAVSIFIKEYND
ncbi:hypothetical protein LCGC14_2102100 [marine sediment metagenome]|uniref:Uncharacterized protein n=1 Tax=marine sediment metagenome TaxID=412755 RepID=A0A0F9E9R3_9ZZZZ